MADDYVRIVRTTEDGTEVHSRVLTESLPVWLEVGWEVAADFLADDEPEAEPLPEFDYADWLAAKGSDETPEGELSQSEVDPVDEEN